MPQFCRGKKQAIVAVTVHCNLNSESKTSPVVVVCSWEQKVDRQRHAASVSLDKEPSKLSESSVTKVQKYLKFKIFKIKLIARI